MKKNVWKYAETSVLLLVRNSGDRSVEVSKTDPEVRPSDLLPRPVGIKQFAKQNPKTHQPIATACQRRIRHCSRHSSRYTSHHQSSCRVEFRKTNYAAVLGKVWAITDNLSFNSAPQATL